jgi:hypothetical protein
LMGGFGGSRHKKSRHDPEGISMRQVRSQFTNATVK